MWNTPTSLSYNFVVVQSCPTLCDPKDCSIPGFSVLHRLSELAQIRIHWVGDVISSSVVPFSSCLLSFPASGSFPMSWLFPSGGQSTGVSASASVLPINTKSWFTLGMTFFPQCSPRDSQESSPIPQFESISSSVLNLLYGPTLTSKHDYWKNHSFDYTDLCWQSNVSAF